MGKTLFTLCAAVSVLVLSACTDDDSFSTSPSNVLTFSTDTVRFDTLFATVPSSTRTFWVYNKSGDGIRCSTVRLAGGNQMGFRVNVDGEYLSPEAGYQVHNLEIRKNDSVRVFVEITSPENASEGPQLVEDELVFGLESGVEQRVNLNAYTWNATILRNAVISDDTTIDGSDRPVVIYGQMRVDSMATLSITPGTTLYFHEDAGIDVYGRLLSEGTADNNIVLRGDRTDRMFDYLPYDMVSGQWQGIRLRSSSYGNSISYTDIHSTFDDVTLTHCTLAQFYPFDSMRGAALMFTNVYNGGTVPLVRMDCINSIVTGYGDDMFSGVKYDGDEDVAFNYRFVGSLVRTPEVDDAEHFVDVLFEDVESTDSVSGDENFELVDIDMQRYDFHLVDNSPAVDAANKDYSLSDDRDGRLRDEAPDIGCYEFYRKDDTPVE